MRLKFWNIHIVDELGMKYEIKNTKLSNVKLKMQIKKDEKRDSRIASITIDDTSHNS